MIKVTGKTYDAKNLLKDCGFTFNATDKCWIGDNDALTELKRVSTRTFSSRNQSLYLSLVIDVIEDVVEQPAPHKSESTKCAAYHIDGSKSDEFRAAAVKLFADPNLKKELQWRMSNLNCETMSFDLDVRLSCPKEILDIAKKLGKGVNVYA